MLAFPRSTKQTSTTSALKQVSEAAWRSLQCLEFKENSVGSLASYSPPLDFICSGEESSDRCKGGMFVMPCSPLADCLNLKGKSIKFDNFEELSTATLRTRCLS